MCVIRVGQGGIAGVAVLFIIILSAGWSQGAPPDVATALTGDHRSHLSRAKVFLQAGDFHRAIDACLEEVRERPSAASYLYLTYVYQALDRYLEHLAQTDQWVKVELLYLSLASGRIEDLTDPPDVLARIAKEVVQQAAQRQSDISAGMANRLDEPMVVQLWKQQTAWRQRHPQEWWFGIPPEWPW